MLNYNVFANFQCSLYSSSLEFPLCFQFNFNTLSTKLVYIGAVQNMCISFWSGVLATLKEKEELKKKKRSLHFLSLKDVENYCFHA